MSGTPERRPTPTTSIAEGTTISTRPPAHHKEQGIEWEDDMVEVNRMTTPANMRWNLVDRDTGAETPGSTGSSVLATGSNAAHQRDGLRPPHAAPVPYPWGRTFLVLARDGVVEANLVWKDTVLVRTGETVDLLLDVTNPGRWMAHCHIAEHHESGMMLSFNVNRRPTAGRW